MLKFIGLVALFVGFLSLLLGWMEAFPSIMIIIGGLALACLPSK